MPVNFVSMQDIKRLPSSCSDEAGEGVVYVLSFDTGLVKVGRTARPRARIASLVADAYRYSGARLLRGWVSPPHVGYEVNEDLLLRYAVKSSAEVRKSEYFVGVSFDDLTDFAKKLTTRPAPTADPSAAAERPDPNSPESIRAYQAWLEKIRLPTPDHRR